MADEVSQLVELGQFLKFDTRNDLKLKALEYIKGLTSHGEYVVELLHEGSILKALVALAANDPVAEVKLDSVRTLVNFTTNDVVASSPLLVESCLLKFLLKDIIDKDSKISCYSSMLLTNITRIDSNCEKIRQALDGIEEVTFRDILLAFTKCNYNSNCQLHYLGSFISNLLTLKSYRVALFNKCRDLLADIPAYTTYTPSNVRRASAARILKNCSFESEFHDLLLNEEIGLLVQLLLPLAGPEEFSDDEMEKLPLDLQYLPEDKTREDDPEIRLMLVNTLHQLCTTKFGRETLWNNGVYYILREMHTNEKDEKVIDALEHVIQLLIMDEPEKGMENLKGFEIPADVIKMLEKKPVPAEKNDTKSD